ncbi:hypothetical protein ESCO_003608 [Escovopsis weberi]|uniref:Uncharacterized protein n=1 Tax=Escovopsis weberi TaxID=150374 RepID=A0A0M9VXJ9_ESCWE|nr:hypothetical protein ESCO_003608 [Escovopsis weberi]
MDILGVFRFGLRRFDVIFDVVFRGILVVVLSVSVFVVFASGLHLVLEVRILILLDLCFMLQIVIVRVALSELSLLVRWLLLIGLLLGWGFHVLRFVEFCIRLHLNCLLLCFHFVVLFILEYCHVCSSRFLLVRCIVMQDIFFPFIFFVLVGFRRPYGFSLV